MEDVSFPQDAGAVTVPARVSDIPLIAEYHKTSEIYYLILDCLSAVDGCTSDREVNDEVDAGVNRLKATFDKSNKQIAHLVPVSHKTESELLKRQRARLADLDLVMKSPEQVLSRHINMMFAGLAAACARGVAAWSMAGVSSESTLDRLRLTARLLAPQLDDIRDHVKARYDELDRTHPGLSIADKRIRLTGMEDSNTVWLVEPMRKAA